MSRGRGPLRALLLPLALSLACAGGPLVSRPPAEPVIVEVFVAYPGASPAEVEQGVVMPLEQSLMGLGELESVQSSSGEGEGRIRLRFEDRADPWVARERVREALSDTSHLPADAEAPLILGQRDEAVATVVVQAQTWADLAALTEAVREELLREAGVRDLRVLGEVEEHLEIRLSADRLVALDLTPSEVEAVIRSGLLSARLGSGGALLSTDRVDLDDLMDLLLRPGLRLGDVAELRLAMPDPTERTRSLTSRPVALLELSLTAPGGRPAKVREHEQEVIGRLVQALDGFPGTSIRPAAPRSRVQLLTPGDAASLAVLEQPGLPGDAVWVPGSPPELWSWVMPAPALAELVHQRIPGVQARALVPEEQTVVAVVAGDDRAAVEAFRDELQQRLPVVDGVETVSSTVFEDRAEFELVIDRPRLAAMGLSATDVAQATRALDGLVLDGSPEIRVLVDGLGTGDDPARAELLLRTPDGLQRLPLSAVAEISMRAAPGRLDRLDGRSVERVIIDLDAPTQGPPAALQEELSLMELPLGVSVSLHACPACPLP